jgi:ABC-type lipoprotein release transport system permease subunit
MRLIFKLAFRNVWRHRGQSFVIGAILFLGALLMTLGNGVVTGMEQGLQRTVAGSFTGDLVLVPKAQASDNVFLEMMGRSLEPLYGYRALAASLDSSPWVSAHLPIGKGTVLVVNEEDGSPVILYVLGVDFDRYRAFFPGNLAMIEGGMPPSGAPGLLLPTGARLEIQRQANLWFLPKGAKMDTSQLSDADAKRHASDLILKRDMVLMGFNEANTATDIRLPVDGIFKYRALNNIFGSFALADIESFRRCTGYFTADQRALKPLAGRDSALLALDESGLDRLLGGEPLAAASVTSAPPADPVAPVPKDEAAQAPLPATTSPSDRGTTPLDDGAYNLVLVALRDPSRAAAAQAGLNALFAKQKLEVRAISWKQALGPIGSLALLIKAALAVFVGLLFLVAVIIIVNTLTMAALERTPELGMMRAIGARKGFIGRMFLAETAVLSALFGGLGIGTGALATLALSALHLTSANDMLQLAFGGDTFRPALAPGDFLISGAELILVALAAVAYPMRLAQRISPLDAVYRE